MARFEKKLTAVWQQRFMALLPVILNYVSSAFWRLNPEAKAEAVQEAVANAYVAFQRLMRQGRDSLIYPTVLARFAIKQVRAGRKVGTRMNVKDISSTYSQKKKHFGVERLDRYDPEEGCWKEAVVEDHRTPVADQVSFRIDFPAWLKTLPVRDRKIAKMLAEGHRTSDVAHQFGLSLARISQLRREFFDSWQQFQGELAEREQIALLTAA